MTEDREPRRENRFTQQIYTTVCSTPEEAEELTARLKKLEEENPLPENIIIPDRDPDFTDDTPGFWDGFWERKGGLGYCGADPDTHSKALKQFHKRLWSRELPNGQVMELSEGYGNDYLIWNGMRFASDSVTTGFRYERCRPLIDSVQSSMNDYRGWMESIIRKTYTIGGSIIFPKHMNSINQCRGRSPYIRDRWDLTLECIRRFYNGEESPLADCLESDRKFFDLFVDFKGYVDFFFLQDCVSADYSEVKLWIDTPLFEKDPFPRDRDEYLLWIQRNLEFVEKRNRRIEAFLRS